MSADYREMWRESDKQLKMKRDDLKRIREERDTYKNTNEFLDKGLNEWREKFLSTEKELKRTRAKKVEWEGRYDTILKKFNLVAQANIEQTKDLKERDETIKDLEREIESRIEGDLRDESTNPQHTNPPIIEEQNRLLTNIANDMWTIIKESLHG